MDPGADAEMSGGAISAISVPCLIAGPGSFRPRCKASFSSDLVNNNEIITCRNAECILSVNWIPSSNKTKAIVDLREAIVCGTVRFLCGLELRQKGKVVKFDNLAARLAKIQGEVV